ncbi:hypothetical protein OG226_13445 [Streptomyces sp. NBC_01261]|nr:hypothetical protein [Streptomyces sp. NBC_01261]
MVGVVSVDPVRLAAVTTGLEYADVSSLLSPTGVGTGARITASTSIRA